MKIIPLVVLIVLFTSCSSKPDIEKVKTILSEQISNESNGDIALLSIEKTNAQDNEFMGQKTHSIEYKSTVEINEDCYMYINKSGVGSFFLSFKTYKEQPEFIPSMQMQIVECSKGDKVNFVDKMTFFETENGWIEK